MSKLVTVERRDGVAVVTLNRPEARNALSGALLAELNLALRALKADSDLRAMVLTGADPAFCAGLDLKELEAGRQNLDDGNSAINALLDLGKPLIGAINGHAVTGGLEIALACDFRIGSERARFADTHARVGIMPGWGLTVRLPRAVGFGFAKEMSLTGNYVDAPTALRTGLINRLVPHEDLLPTAVALAQDVASCDPAMISRIHSLYGKVEETRNAPAVEAEGRAHDAWASSFDAGSIRQKRDAVIGRGRAQQHGD